jgi:hypothetical protein
MTASAEAGAGGRAYSRKQPPSGVESLHGRMRHDFTALACSVVGRGGAYLVSLRYVIRCGLVATSPRVRRRHCSDPKEFPSKKVSLLSPSKARMCVAMRSESERS